MVGGVTLRVGMSLGKEEGANGVRGAMSMLSFELILLPRGRVARVRVKLRSSLDFLSSSSSGSSVAVSRIDEPAETSRFIGSDMTESRLSELEGDNENESWALLKLWSGENEAPTSPGVEGPFEESTVVLLVRLRGRAPGAVVVVVGGGTITEGHSTPKAPRRASESASAPPPPFRSKVDDLWSGLRRLARDREEARFRCLGTPSGWTTCKGSTGLRPTPPVLDVLGRPGEGGSNEAERSKCEAKFV